ncbi:MAG: hypothetical protein ACJ71Z_08965 [Aeromicrobium sp.]
MFSLRWWTGGRGLAGVAQWPNAAITVWALTVVVRWLGAGGSRLSDSTLAAMGNGALLVWGLDEVVRGVSPIRRVMGGAVLAAVLIRLLA